jgi:hypothetical protein
LDWLNQDELGEKTCMCSTRIPATFSELFVQMKSLSFSVCGLYKRIYVALCDMIFFFSWTLKLGKPYTPLNAAQGTRAAHPIAALGRPIFRLFGLFCSFSFFCFYFFFFYVSVFCYYLYYNFFDLKSEKCSELKMFKM